MTVRSRLIEYEHAVRRTSALIDAARAVAARSSVERGDPFSVLSAVSLGHIAFTPDGLAYAATADGAEPDSPQPVTADPETLDTQPNRDDSDAVPDLAHVSQDDLVGQEAQLRAVGANYAASFYRREIDRRAFLARVQRIDPRERKP